MMQNEILSFQEVSWESVADAVKKVNPRLHEIICDIDPGPEYRLYVGEYPYGVEILKYGKFQVPVPGYGMLPLRDDRVSKQIRQDLSYNIETNPVSLVLKNCVEVFLDKPVASNPIIFFRATEGNVFGLTRVIYDRPFQPAYLWNISSGMRSVYMLPKISQTKKYKRLRSELNIDVIAPNSIQDHWDIFRKISSQNLEEVWSSKVLYFSGKWFEKLDDKAWHELRSYLWESTGRAFASVGNFFIWDIVFSSILRSRNIRPSLYVSNSVKYLCQIGAGLVPALEPYVNEMFMPCGLIQKVFVEVYGLGNYCPTLMGPAYFNLYDKNSIVYYSLQNSNIFDTPKKKDGSSFVSYLYEIQSLYNKYKDEVLRDALNLGGTRLHDFFRNGQMQGCHPSFKKYSILKSTDFLFENDPRFSYSPYKKTNNEVAAHSSLFKGCFRFGVNKVE